MERHWNPDLIGWMRRHAMEAGFALAGVAGAPAAEDGSGKLSAERFGAWLKAGHAGEMSYLERRSTAGDLLRSSARVAMPWARSVVVCALNYNLPDGGGKGTPRSIDPADPEQGWIARYSWTADRHGGALDYHDDLLRRLRQIEHPLQDRTGCQTRAYVDTGPLLEREFAARAGIGWIGKNTCVLNQELGSWLLLGVIVTSLPLPEPEFRLAPDRCGSCSRCIDACPTGALLVPDAGAGATRSMDASRCIAYLTIEKKGSIPHDLRGGMGRQIFGCDICQEVCPWNRHAPPADLPDLQRRDDLVNPELAWLAGLNAAEFKRLFKGSPLERTGRRRLRRNIAIAMGNSGSAGFHARLAEWAAGPDDPALQEAAAWALTRLPPPEPVSASIELPPTPPPEP